MVKLIFGFIDEAVEERMKSMKSNLANYWKVQRFVIFVRTTFDEGISPPPQKRVMTCKGVRGVLDFS